MTLGWLVDTLGMRYRERMVSPCAEHRTGELSLDGWSDEAYTLNWTRQEGELWRDWRRLYPNGPRWRQIADYHRYGWTAHQKYPDRTWEEVLCGFWRAYAAGKWDTRDPWGRIEEAIRRGWESAAARPASRRINRSNVP